MPQAGPYSSQRVMAGGDVFRTSLRARAFPLGVELRLAPVPRLALALELSYLPVYAADVDDHLLRNKLSTSAGVGHGALGAVDLRWRLRAGPAASPRNPYVACRVEALTWRVSTAQTQEWYGDDPAAPGEETGMVMSGIDHETTKLELRDWAGAGFGF